MIKVTWSNFSFPTGYYWFIGTGLLVALHAVNTIYIAQYYNFTLLVNLKLTNTAHNNLKEH